MSCSWSQTLKGQVYSEYYLSLVNDGQLFNTATTGGENSSILTTGYIRKDDDAYTPFIYKLNAQGGLDWFYDYPQNSSANYVYKPEAIKVTYPDKGVLIVGNLYEMDDIALEKPLKGFAIKVDVNGQAIYERIFDCSYTIKASEDYSIIFNCKAFVINDLTVDLMGGAVLAGYILNDTSKQAMVFPIDAGGQVSSNYFKVFDPIKYQNSEVVSIKSIPGEGHVLLLLQEKTSSEVDHTPGLIKINNQFTIDWARDVWPEEGDNQYIPFNLEISQDYEKYYILGHEADNHYITQLSQNSVDWTKKYNLKAYSADEWYLEAPTFAKDLSDNLYLLFSLFAREGTVAHSIVIKTNSQGTPVWFNQYGDREAGLLASDIATVLNNNGPFQISQDVTLTGRYIKTALNGLNIRIRTNDGTTDCLSSEIDYKLSNHTYKIEEAEIAQPNYKLNSLNPGIGSDEPDFQLSKCSGPLFRGALEENKSIFDTGGFEEGHMQVFPNPNQGNFTLQVPFAEQSAQVSIYDLSGKRIRFQETHMGQESIHLSGLPKGTYFIRCVQGYESSTKRIVVQ